MNVNNNFIGKIIAASVEAGAVLVATSLIRGGDFFAPETVQAAVVAGVAFFIIEQFAPTFLDPARFGYGFAATTNI